MKLKTIQNRFEWAVIHVIVLCALCFNSDNAVAQESHIEFEQQKLEINLLEENESEMLFELVANTYPLLMHIDLESESVKLYIHSHWIETHFNYTYDIDLETALGQIKWLESPKQKDIILLLPEATEEFLSFQLIKFNKKRYELEAGEYILETNEYNDVPNFYTSHAMRLIQKGNQFMIQLGDYESHGAFGSIR